MAQSLKNKDLITDMKTKQYNNRILFRILQKKFKIQMNFQKVLKLRIMI